jgi:hypothetical protein
MRKHPFNIVTGEASDPVIKQLIANDKSQWYRNPNLRLLYLFRKLCVIGIDGTSGFDDSFVNGIQTLEFWQGFFGKPKGSTLGILTPSYGLGAITSMPFISILPGMFASCQSS